jgi:RNA polymerase sigma-70 factor (ECF subfamily)
VGDFREKEFLEATLPHLDTLYRVARHIGADRWNAEDLVQETYLRAFAAFDTHVGPSTRAWLVTICVNLARSEGRRRSRRVAESPAAATDLEDLEPIGPDVYHQVQARLDKEAVVRALEGLTGEQRRAIVLMDLAGHTAAEVAEMLGVPRGTVLARVHRGRRRLARVLAAEGIGRDLP